VEYDPQLMTELAKCYARAALDQLLRDEPAALTSTNTTIKDKESNDISAVRDVRAELHR
jgi:hypothetical protein